MNNSQQSGQLDAAAEHIPWILGQLVALLAEQRAAMPQPRVGDHEDVLPARSFQRGVVREIDGLGLPEPPGADMADGQCAHRIVCGRTLLPVCDVEVVTSRRRSGRPVIRGVAAAVPMAMSMTVVNGMATVRLWRKDWAPSTFCVADRELTQAMVSLHDALWFAVDGRCGHDCSAALGVPGHLAGVLAQLASGVTDRTAQRALGLSLRTYSRRVADLMDELGAESRFQAGSEAARRGWV